MFDSNLENETETNPGASNLLTVNVGKICLPNESKWTLQQTKWSLQNYRKLKKMIATVVFLEMLPRERHVMFLNCLEIYLSIFSYDLSVFRRAKSPVQSWLLYWQVDKWILKWVKHHRNFYGIIHQCSHTIQS